MRYCRFGAVNESGVAPGWSCVATVQARPGTPAGRSNVSVDGASSNPRAHMIAAGMFM